MSNDGVIIVFEALNCSLKMVGFIIFLNEVIINSTILWAYKISHFLTIFERKKGIVPHGTVFPQGKNGVPFVGDDPFSIALLFQGFREDSLKVGLRVVDNRRKFSPIFPQ